MLSQLFIQALKANLLFLAHLLLSVFTLASKFLVGFVFGIRLQPKRKPSNLPTRVEAKRKVQGEYFDTQATEIQIEANTDDQKHFLVGLGLKPYLNNGQKWFVDRQGMIKTVSLGKQVMDFQWKIDKLKKLGYRWSSKNRYWYMTRS